MTILYYLKPTPFTPPSGIPEENLWKKRKRHTKSWRKVLEEGERIKRRRQQEEEDFLILLNDHESN